MNLPTVNISMFKRHNKLFIQIIFNFKGSFPFIFLFYSYWMISIFQINLRKYTRSMQFN